MLVYKIKMFLRTFFSLNLLLLGGLFMSTTLSSFAGNLPATIFPLDNYDQNVDTWLPPSSPNYNKPLISAEFQQQRMQELYQHLYSTADNSMSPWSANFINQIFQQHPGLPELEATIVSQFSNHDKDSAHLNYGENFRLYPYSWIDKISDNMQLNQLQGALIYSAAQRAILVQNASARVLPTNEVSFYSYEIAGQGYPFDNLQASRLEVGTPAYIVGYTKDKRWSLVITPAVIGWVETKLLASVTDEFIATWQKAAQANLVAVTQTETPVVSAENQAYLFTTYIGTYLPLQNSANQSTANQNNTDNYYKVLIPVRDQMGQAQIHFGLISKQQADKMPLTATPANFAKLLKSLKNRPYGWGGLYAYNDCSAEMKALFLPFGIWLPRNSSQQGYMGNMTDKTADSPAQRIAYLIDKGHPLMSIIYIGGHVILYVGNYPQNSGNTAANSPVNAMTYQDVWGLSPPDYSSRAIIGQSVFIPLLLSYPEDPTLQSLAAKKYFQVSNLDEMPATPINMPALFFNGLKQPAANTSASASVNTATKMLMGVDLDRQ